MATIHNTIELQAPPEVVFDLMADCERYPDWVATVEDARMTMGDRIEAGTEYEEVRTVGPIRTTSHWQVTTFDRPHRQVHIGLLPFGAVELTIETEARDDGGTRLDHTVELTAIPRFRPLGWVFEHLFLVRIFERDITESLATFTALVDAET